MIKNIKNTRIMQILYYLLIAELLVVIVRIDNEPMLSLIIMKWVLIVTTILFVISIAYYFWQTWNKQNE